MSEFAVRAANASDEAAVLELAAAEMRAQEERDARFALRPEAAARYALYLRDRIRDIDSAVFVAESGGRVVGSVVASVRTQESFFVQRRFGYVSDLMVEPGTRRQGCGRALWERSRLWFRGLGIGAVRLHVAVSSPEARAFWKSLGAEDFLCEAWIDLPPQAVESPGPRAAGATAAGATAGVAAGGSAVENEVGEEEGA
jgi:GNAT superfamily N-acetyltransferase